MIRDVNELKALSDVCAYIGERGYGRIAERVKELHDAEVAALKAENEMLRNLLHPFLKIWMGGVCLDGGFECANKCTIAVGNLQREVKEHPEYGLKVTSRKDRS